MTFNITFYTYYFTNVGSELNDILEDKKDVIPFRKESRNKHRKEERLHEYL